MRVLVLPALILLLALVAPSAGARDATEVEARWVSLRMKTAERLHELAAWCTSAKLFASRAEVYEQILRIDGEDATARRRLRYRRNADGDWVRDPKYKPPRNLRDGAADFQARRAEVGAWFAETASELVEDARAEADHLRYAIAALGLAVDPTNAVMRGWNDEARDPEADAAPVPWILAETLRSRTRGPRLRQVGKDAAAAVPTPATGEAEGDDLLGDVRWQHVFQGDRVRVVGEPGRGELMQAHRLAEATWPVFREAFGVDGAAFDGGGRYGKGPTLYVTLSQATGNRFLAAQPGHDEAFLGFVKRLVALWLRTRPAVLVKSPIAAIRLEGGPRQLLQGMLHRAFGLSADRAWAVEGLSLYLTWQVTGTRYLASVAQVDSRYGEQRRDVPDYERELSDSEADWLALASLLVDGPEKPDLYLLVGKTVNQLETKDVLYAYAIVAFVLEGRPAAAGAFFRRLAAKDGNDLEVVCRETLGFGVDALERRIARWLRERARPAGG